MATMRSADAKVPTPSTPARQHRESAPPRGWRADIPAAASPARCRRAAPQPSDGWLSRLAIRIAALSPISTQPENAFLEGFRRRQLRREWRSGDQRDAREQSTPLAHLLAPM